MKKKDLLYLLVVLVPFGITISLLFDAGKRAYQIKNNKDLGGEEVTRSWFALFIDLLKKKVGFWN